MSLPGHEFLAKLESVENDIKAQTSKIIGLQSSVPEENKEEISSRIDSAVGSGALILNGKCKQFRQLCNKNITEATQDQPDGTGEFPTTREDLEGFWDMISLPIRKVLDEFARIERLKEAGWQSEQDESRDVRHETDGKSVPKPAMRKKPLASKNDAPDSERLQKANKQKEEARKRLMEFKKAARDRLQNSAEAENPLTSE